MYAMVARFAEAGRATLRVRSIFRDLGMLVWSGAVGHGTGDAAVIEGDLKAAEQIYRESCEIFERVGSHLALASMSAKVALTLMRQGRYEEAESYVRVAEDLGAPEDWGWRRAPAAMLRKAGRLATAEALLRRDLELVRRTDLVTEQADTLVDLAELVADRRRIDEAIGMLDRSLGLYEAKGNLVVGKRVRGIRMSMRG